MVGLSIEADDEGLQAGLVYAVGSKGEGVRQSACAREGRRQKWDEQLGMQHQQTRNHFGRDVLRQQVDDEDARRDGEEAALKVELIPVRTRRHLSRSVLERSRASPAVDRGKDHTPLLARHLVREDPHSWSADSQRRQQLSDARLFSRSCVDLLATRAKPASAPLALLRPPVNLDRREG
jgi:hypothetical protein